MQKISFLLENLYQSTGLPLHYIDTSKGQCILSYGYAPSANPFLLDSQLLARFLHKVPSKPSLLELEFELDFILYAFFFDMQGNCIIAGPILLMNHDLTLEKNYIAAHNISADFKLSSMTLSAFISAAKLLFFAATGKMAENTDILLTEIASVFEQPSLDSMFTAYFDTDKDKSDLFSHSEELSIMKHIEDGDIDYFRQRISVADINIVTNRISKVANRPLKNLEYLICTSIALACRSAIAGGLDTETAYSMSASLMQQLELCQTAEHYVSLQKKAMLSYAQKVKEAKEKRNDYQYIDQCKNYIAQHLNKRFSLDDLAHTLGLTKSYLSRRFTEEEGISIWKYAQGKRIDAAKNMLKYSDIPVSKIASYLCFNTQSHFGVVFKEFTGMTPKQYRNKEQMLDYTFNKKK